MTPNSTICARMVDSRSGKAVSYLHRHSVGCPVHVHCRETEQPKAGADQAILSPVVINQSIAMVAAVVFDGQPLNGIEEVWTA